MSTMTLEQMESELRRCVSSGHTINLFSCQRMADAIDTELKTRGKPVAWMHPSLNDDHPFPDECLSAGEVDGWIPLYTAPPVPKIEVTDAMVKRAQDTAGNNRC